MAGERGQFSSKLGFILAAAGSAVGLGNLVAFPVMASKNGGAAFLIIYLFFIAFICYPVMMAEISMGRRTNRNPVGAFSQLSDGHKGWRLAGMLAILTPFMIAVFYTVITVWLVVYIKEIATGGLAILSTEAAFGEIVARPSLFGYLIGLLILIFFILLGGVKGGIERLARVLMPTLAAMLVLLTLFVLTLDNAIIGIRYYLVPDFSRIELSVINGALSQAFFSLSLGMGILITYGSYFSSEDNIAQSTRMVAIADTSIAFFAGLLILPAIFAFDPNTNTDDLSTSSIGLIFSFLPQIFLSMQAAVGYTGASVVAIVFFTLVFFAALTSLVSIIEIPISCWIDELKLSRKKAVGLQAFLLTLFAVPAVMSLGISDFFTNFTSYGGATKSFFDLVSDVFYETILPFVGFTVCIFCAYRWKVSGLKSELVKGDESYDGSNLEKYINFSLGTVIPVVLLLVFISTVAQIYFA
ncbi:sodium-dependent transporter [Gammaproteobacteria bacterium]|uniref:Sodium-dependent transporter n=1 Tax=OM182 bacterium MED-G28 TaxID=1986256 RepID=A0A2A5WFD2_9GAMM|nr:sodium-dependent transporter [Gammaproteobacteria bacterium]PDH35132.1 MAG: sodium-dependent transporter [OM182 bacterium MED-G28]